jgi:hypothetical protein
MAGFWNPLRVIWEKVSEAPKVRNGIKFENWTLISSQPNTNCDGFLPCLVNYLIEPFRDVFVHDTGAFANVSAAQNRALYVYPDRRWREHFYLSLLWYHTENPMYIIEHKKLELRPFTELIPRWERWGVVSILPFISTVPTVKYRGGRFQSKR